MQAIACSCNQPLSVYRRIGCSLNYLISLVIWEQGSPVLSGEQQKGTHSRTSFSNSSVCQMMVTDECHIWIATQLLEHCKKALLPMYHKACVAFEPTCFHFSSVRIEVLSAACRWPAGMLSLKQQLRLHPLAPPISTICSSSHVHTCTKPTPRLATENLVSHETNWLLKFHLWITTGMCLDLCMSQLTRLEFTHTSHE